MTTSSIFICIAAGLFVFFAGATAHLYGETNRLQYIIDRMKEEARIKQEEDEQRHQEQLARRRERRRKKNGKGAGE